MGLTSGENRPARISSFELEQMIGRGRGIGALLNGRFVAPRA
jgi:hypothetical protein